MILGESERKGRYASVWSIGNNRQPTNWLGFFTSEMQSKTLVLVSLGWWVSKLFGWFLHLFRRRLHPGRLTWNLQITHLERKMIFQTPMTMFYVNLPGCRTRMNPH